MTELNLSSPEMKAIASVEDLSFDSYRRANDTLRDVNERKSDNTNHEQLDRIEAFMQRVEQKSRDEALAAKRPVFETGARSSAASEHKQAIDSYIRSGETAGLKLLETRSFQTGVGSDGGFLVAPETEHFINKALIQLSPMRDLATVRQISSAVYKQPFAPTGLPTGWAAETATRPQTNTIVLEERQFPTMELYAMPAATQTILDDAIVNLDQWISGEVEQAFATQETSAFVSGDGIAKPKGFLGYTNVANAAWTSGNVGFFTTGAAGAFGTGLTASDCLINLIYGVKSGYRQNANFVMNRNTQAMVRKLKDASGDYLWSPPDVAGGQASLMGFNVTEIDAMPDPAAGSYSLAFGDFKRGYLIVDRMGVRILRDPYSAKPYVLFYTTKRVGGGIADFEAIKLLKFA
jgi:HK97 family phage major capsid protein